MVDKKAQIGTVKAGYQQKRVLQTEQPDDIPAHPLGGRRRERTDRWAFGQNLHKFRDAQITGTKILSPLRHAMRLVHRNQRKTDPLAQGLQARCLQAFRCDIEQLVLALRGLPQNACALFDRLSTGQTSCRNACLTQRAHLVAHERNQG